jgi:hypothetical protein
MTSFKKYKRGREKPEKKMNDRKSKKKRKKEESFKGIEN